MSFQHSVPPTRACIVLFTGLLLATQPLLGQMPRLQVEVDTTVVTVGDRITYLVSVDHAPDSRVAWPDSLDLAPFEVLGGRALPQASQGEAVRSSIALTLTAFEVGDLEIPSFPVELVGPEGESTLLHTDRFGIRVESVGLDKGGDIREVRGPFAIPVSPTGVALLVLALLLAVGLAWALYRRMRRRGEAPGEVALELPSRPPHEVALEALARLEASPLLDRGEVKEYHIQVSEILRTYVEGRFRVPALEMTTRYIMEGMEGVGVEPSVRERFRRFLDQCDLVKFAKSRPDEQRSQRVLALGRELVEESSAEPSQEAV